MIVPTVAIIAIPLRAMEFLHPPFSSAVVAAAVVAAVVALAVVALAVVAEEEPAGAAEEPAGAAVAEVAGAVGVLGVVMSPPL